MFFNGQSFYYFSRHFFIKNSGSLILNVGMYIYFYYCINATRDANLLTLWSRLSVNIATQALYKYFIFTLYLHHYILKVHYLGSSRNISFLKNVVSNEWICYSGSRKISVLGRTLSIGKVLSFILKRYCY